MSRKNARNVEFDVTSDSALVRVVEDAHEQAGAALAAGASCPLDAVVWLSAHLAAVGRVITPVATSRLGETAAAQREGHRRDLELERMLRIAERCHSGDVLASGIEGERLRTSILSRLDAHAEVEHTRLTALADLLDVEEQRALAEAYLDALKKAPTRPHPHLPHHGLSGAIAFRVNAVRDRLLDTMDSRPVPLPRAPHEARRPGRWGSYLLGQMQPEVFDSARGSREAPVQPGRTVLRPAQLPAAPAYVDDRDGSGE